MIEKPLQRHSGRLAKDEMYCGSCFGAEQSDYDCNSCEEVQDRYQRKGWTMANEGFNDQVVPTIYTDIRGHIVDSNQ